MTHRRSISVLAQAPIVRTISDLAAGVAVHGTPAANGTLALRIQARQTLRTLYPRLQRILQQMALTVALGLLEAIRKIRRRRRLLGLTLAILGLLTKRMRTPPKMMIRRRMAKENGERSGLVRKTRRSKERALRATQITMLLTLAPSA